MKTIVTRIKSVIKNDVNLKTYVKDVQICADGALPDVSLTLLPFIAIAPVSTTETWIAQQKQAVNIVNIYIIQDFEVQETSIIGNSVKKGVLEIVEDLDNAIRSYKLPDGDGIAYLSKPIEITNVNYAVGAYGDQVFSFVAMVTLQCVRLFTTTVQAVNG